MHFLCLLLIHYVLLHFVNANDIKLEQSFKDYQLKYDRHYQSGEEKHRLDCFRRNLLRINHHKSTEPDAILGWTGLTDRCEDEIQVRLGFKPAHQDNDQGVYRASIDKRNTTIGNGTIDWRPTAVSPIMDQGQCGSCWAFSALVAIEGAWAVKYGKLYSLSAQELVDCDNVQMPGNCTGGEPKDNEGCVGGIPQYAVEWVIKNKGLNTEEAYPYTHHDTPITIWCEWDKCKKSYAPITDVKRIASNEESILKALQTSPLSAGIAVSPALIDYKGGILRHCESFKPDHGVGIVGFGMDDNGKGYWIMKNSWGKDWGENGFFRLEYGSDQCGITNWVTQVIA